MMTERMNPAELQTIREFLGLTQEALAIALGVKTETVRFWEAGRPKYPIPYRVHDELAALEEYTGRAVGALINAQDDAADVVVAVYRTDEEIRAYNRSVPWITARWWRHVVARAALEVPGLEIRGAGEVDAEDALAALEAR